MVEDLLCISKILLEQIGRFDFTENEKNYIIKVVRKTIFITLIELGYLTEKNKPY